MTRLITTCVQVALWAGIVWLIVLAIREEDRG